MGWTITPNDASINESSGVATITARTDSNKEYTITYTDSYGCMAQTNYTLKGYDCDDISITAASPSFTSGGGTIAVGSCPSGCTSYITSSATVDWLALVVGSDGTLSLSASSNPGDARTASVTIKVGSNECSAKAISASQEAKASVDYALTLLGIKEEGGMTAIWTSDDETNKSLVGGNPSEVGLSYFSKSYTRWLNYDYHHNKQYYTIGGRQFYPCISRKPILTESDLEDEDKLLPFEDIEKLGNASLKVKITFNKDNYLNDEYEDLLYGSTSDSLTFDNDTFILGTNYNRAVDLSEEGLTGEGLFYQTKIKIPNNHTLFANNTSYTGHTSYTDSTDVDYGLISDMINTKIETVKGIHEGSLGFLYTDEDEDEYDFRYYKDLTSVQKDILNECPQAKIEMWVEGYEGAKISFNIYLQSVPMVHKYSIGGEVVKTYGCSTLSNPTCTTESTYTETATTRYYSVGHRAFFFDCIESIDGHNFFHTHSRQWLKDVEQYNTMGNNIFASRGVSVAFYCTFRDYIPNNIQDIIPLPTSDLISETDTAQTASIADYRTYGNSREGTYNSTLRTFNVAVGGNKVDLTNSLQPHTGSSSTYLVGYTPLDYYSHSLSDNPKPVDINKRTFHCSGTSTDEQTYNTAAKYGDTVLIIYIGVNNSNTIKAMYTLPLSSYKSYEEISPYDADIINYEGNNNNPPDNEFFRYKNEVTGTYSNHVSCN